MQIRIWDLCLYLALLSALGNVSPLCTYLPDLTSIFPVSLNSKPILSENLVTHINWALDFRNLVRMEECSKELDSTGGL